MNLRKTILYLVIILFGILFYTLLMNYTAISQMASQEGMKLSEFVALGNGSALMFWLQFPLAIAVLVILVFLAWWDTSLTDSYLRLRDAKDNKHSRK